MYTNGIGLGENIYGVGAGAANTQSGNANRQGENTAQLTFGKTNAQGDMFGKMLGAGGKLLSDYLTGGMGSGSYGRGAWSPTGG